MPEGQEVPITPRSAEKSSRFRTAWEAIKNFRKGKGEPASTPSIPEPVQNLSEAANQPSTALEAEEPKAEEPESVPDILVEENPELNAFTREELRLFFEFSSTHQQVIQEQLAAGKSLTDIIYKNFCMTDIDNPYYSEDDPDMAIKVRSYTHSRNQVKHALLGKEREEMPNIDQVDHSLGYVDWEVNGGLQSKWDDSDKIGRLYFNIDISRLAQAYLILVRNLARSDPPIHARLKIAEPMISGIENLPIFNRFDKLVLYFEESESEAVYNAAEYLYMAAQQFFLDGTPKFSAPLVDAQTDRQVMRGISFGQEPTYSASENGDRSFSHVRAGILAEVLEEAERDPTIQTDEGKLAQVFFTACKKNDVDPNHPAFNTRSDQFQFIRSKVVPAK